MLGNWLGARVRFAKNTAERLNQVSRVDAICWYLTQVACLATAKDIKVFATAFRGFHSTTKTWDRVAQKEIVNTQALVGCCSLLNTCYGGVGQDFTGRPFNGGYRRSGLNYGPVSPLYRPYKGSYAPTIGGIRRSARVQTHLNGSVPS